MTRSGSCQEVKVSGSFVFFANFITRFGFLSSEMETKRMRLSGLLYFAWNSAMSGALRWQVALQEPQTSTITSLSLNCESDCGLPARSL